MVSFSGGIIVEGGDYGGWSECGRMTFRTGFDSKVAFGPKVPCLAQKSLPDKNVISVPPSMPLARRIGQRR